MDTSWELRAEHAVEINICRALGEQYRNVRVSVCYIGEKPHRMSKFILMKEKYGEHDGFVIEWLNEEQDYIAHVDEKANPDLSMENVRDAVENILENMLIPA